MARKKWERAGYLEGIIAKGISYCGGIHYEPGYSSKPKLMEGFFRVWIGLTDHKLRRTFGALLAFANAHGNYTRAGYALDVGGLLCPVSEEGLWFSAATRDLAAWTGESTTWNVSKWMKDLVDAGLARVILKGGYRTGKATVYLIPTSLLTTSSMEQHRRETQSPPYPSNREILVEETLLPLICCRDEGTRLISPFSSTTLMSKVSVEPSA
jgi:hypothetical protein